MCNEIKSECLPKQNEMRNANACGVADEIWEIWIHMSNGCVIYDMGWDVEWRVYINPVGAGKGVIVL